MLDFLKPKTTIDVIDINKAIKNPTLMGYLSAMTLHGQSGMRHTLSLWQDAERDINAKAIIAYSKRAPVAWAILSSEETDYIVRFEPGQGVYIQVFVDYPFRRKGIGTALLAKAREISGDKKICVVPWSVAASDFYSKNEDKNLHLLMSKARIAK